MWKNKHALVSAKKRKHKNIKVEEPARRWSSDVAYTTNDRVDHEGIAWICRRSHHSGVKTVPGAAYRYWKEAGTLGSAALVEKNVNDDARELR